MTICFTDMMVGTMVSMVFMTACTTHFTADNSTEMATADTHMDAIHTADGVVEVMAAAGVGGR
ncbi:MAG: hypothetical protein FWD03_03710 [Defluviitaleaceae bacterium]|nr:hypothetical protein [Defluviitaleaceae bacterium]